MARQCNSKVGSERIVDNKERAMDENERDPEAELDERMIASVVQES